MSADIVLTLTGRDRVGIVEEVTGVLLDLGGNVETSRMTRLGGEFAILMLVSLPDEQMPGLDPALERLSAEGYKVTTSRTKPASAGAHPGWQAYRIDVYGADHEGILHEIARGLSQRGINIESMETTTTRAPMSGTPLFSITALVAVPPSVSDEDLRAELLEAGRRSNVDIAVAARANE